jgi:protease I
MPLPRQAGRGTLPDTDPGVKNGSDPMETGLKGRKVAILATDGVEQVELEDPRRALDQAGAITHLIAPKEGSIQAMNHDEKGARLPVDRVLGEVRPSDYDALLLPGGVANPDALRMDSKAVQFVREFMLAERPVAAICHGPWMLVEAGAVAGRTLTSWPSLQTDIRNAGGEWVDEECRIDAQLITSRKPEDLPAFCAAIVREFANQIADARVDETSEQSFPASDPPPGPTAIGGEGAARS